MGFEILRFQGGVDEELICPICSGVLEDPLQVPACEHAFCRACITDWISRQPTCPVDRQAVTVSQLRPVSRLMRNLLSRLCTSCDNAPHGCNAVLQLDSLASHLVECEFNPKRPVPCEAGCGLEIPKGELAEHNCVRELRALIATQLNDHKQELAEHQEKLNKYEQELAEHKRTHQEKLNDHKQELAEHQEKLNNYEQELAEHKRTHQGKLNDHEKELAEHKRELALLKDFMREMRLSNPPSMRVLADQTEPDEVVRWANSLTSVRVTRWDFRIINPINDEQMRIKRSLSESGCPPHIIDDLTKYCDYNNWPPGARSAYNSSDWRTIFDKYVCRRVPGEQHVALVLHCDNTHMDEDMIVKPGFVMFSLYAFE